MSVIPSELANVVLAVVLVAMAIWFVSFFVTAVKMKRTRNLLRQEQSTLARDTRNGTPL